MYRYLLLLLLLFSASGCTDTNSNSTADTGYKKITVMVSIEPMASFVEAVGGRRVAVTVMVPKGASPHTYEPRPSQLRAVSSASLYVKVGSGVEFERTWMERIAGLNPQMPVADSSVGVQLLAPSGAEHRKHEDEKHKGHEHKANSALVGNTDPHIWGSPINVVQMIKNICDALVEADPDGTEIYSKNRDSYIEELLALDKEIRALLAGKEGMRVVTYHPAWAYLAAEYGLVEVPIEFEGKSPTPLTVARIIDRAKREGVTLLFASPEFPVRAAEVIAKEVGAAVISISPLERDYLKNMREVASAFSKL